MRKGVGSLFACEPVPASFRLWITSLSAFCPRMVPVSALARFSLVPRPSSLLPLRRYFASSLSFFHPLTISASFWPPKPKELARQVEIRAGRAWLAT